MPSGRVIVITLEDFLRMTDDDYQELVATNSGDYIPNPFHSTVIKITKKRKNPEEKEEEIDMSIDFVDEDDEILPKGPSVIEEIPIEEPPEFPEDLQEERD